MDILLQDYLNVNTNYIKGLTNNLKGSHFIIKDNNFELPDDIDYIINNHKVIYHRLSQDTYLVSRFSYPNKSYSLYVKKQLTEYYQINSTSVEYLRLIEQIILQHNLAKTKINSIAYAGSTNINVFSAFSNDAQLLRVAKTFLTPKEFAIKHGYDIDLYSSLTKATAKHKKPQSELTIRHRTTNAVNKLASMFPDHENEFDQDLIEDLIDIRLADN
jgi:hypothetical protein